MVRATIELNMEAPKDDQNLYIVIADDEIEDHELLKTAIKKCGIPYVVTSVYNGVQLLNLLLKREFYRTDTFRAPDLIILDLKMHLMDGLDALKEIKSHAEIKDIPVYVLTISDATVEKQRALDLGALQAYTKPKHIKELNDLLKNICELEKAKKDRGEVGRSSR